MPHLFISVTAEQKHTTSQFIVCRMQDFVAEEVKGYLVMWNKEAKKYLHVDRTATSAIPSMDLSLYFYILQAYHARTNSNS